MNSKNISKIISGILLGTIVTYQIPVLAYTKDETVYSKINANGTQYETIVSTHLKNSENEEIIKDMSNLFDIKNTNGDETFKQNKNSIIWNTGKEDVYYQGQSNEELPIKMDITYKLNGKKMDAKDIVGRSGKITILLSYKNKDEHIVNINGNKEKLYTPFVVLAGTVIDNSNNRNINIKNGKVIDDGSKTIVLGMAFPGLQESLGLSKEKIDIPNDIEITMDSTDFEMNSIMNFVTPKVIEDNDINMFDDLEKIYNKIDVLQSSSKKIMNGANKLKKGTDIYYKKSKEFNTAMKQVTQGMKEANSNYAKINDGIKKLNSSSSELNSGTKQIVEGISQVETNLNTVNEKLVEILNGGKNLSDGEKELEQGIDAILEKINNIPSSDNSSKISELEKLIKTNEQTISSLENSNKELQIKISNISEESSKSALQLQIESNNSVIKLLTANIKAENATIETLKLTDSNAIIELKAGLNKVKIGIKNVSDGTCKLNTGIKTLHNGTMIFAEKTKELGLGAEQLYKGTDKLSKATLTLKSGSEAMNNGLNILDSSENKLLEANVQLTKGALTLDKGALDLEKGVKKFDKEGIEKICNYINGGIKDISIRMEKLTDLSKEYNNFTMLEDKADGNVKFIMIIDDLKKQSEEEKSKEKVIMDSKEKNEEN